MAEGRGAARQAIAALNARVYAPFDAAAIDWDGRPIPTGYGPRVRRMRQAGGPERRALDPDFANEAFLYHYRLGLHYGYPGCCVLQYAMEAPYVSPLLLRGGIVLGDHVPCDRCLEAYLLDYIRDGAVWLEYPAPAAMVPE